jgi:hypothetical protein
VRIVDRNAANGAGYTCKLFLKRLFHGSKDFVLFASVDPRYTIHLLGQDHCALVEMGAGTATNVGVMKAELKVPSA